MKNWIKVERAKKNISQEALGQALGVSRNAIASIENGRYKANVDFAIELSRYFGKRVEDVFFLKDEDVLAYHRQLSDGTIDAIVSEIVARVRVLIAKKPQATAVEIGEVSGQVWLEHAADLAPGISEHGRRIGQAIVTR